MPDHTFANFDFADLNSIPSELSPEDCLLVQQARTIQPSRRMFYADTTERRYWGLLPPYDGLAWLLDHERYADALVFWCQENGSLDFYGTDGEWGLALFEKRLASSNRVSLKVAENAFIAKGMSDTLATLLLDLQRWERITIGRTPKENLKVIVEPDSGDTPIDSLPSSHRHWPKPIRPYKRPRRLNFVMHIFMGPNAWPPLSAASATSQQI